jgi:hypothetical protein
MMAEQRLPEAIRGVHESIHLSMVDATRLDGCVGNLARKVKRELFLHFFKEEELLVPLFRYLSVFASGAPIPGKKDLMAMVDRLRSELPELRDEHHGILDSFDGFNDAADEEDIDGFGHLRGRFAWHARTEEEVYYPAAIYIGESLCCGDELPAVRSSNMSLTGPELARIRIK